MDAYNKNHRSLMAMKNHEKFKANEPNGNEIKSGDKYSWFKIGKREEPGA